MQNKDLILPFQYAEKINNAIHDTDNDDIDYLGDNESDTQPDSTCADMLLVTVHKLEEQCKEIFEKAEKKIKKAQKHQAKCYNRRHNIGKAFEIGSLVLKHNLCEGVHKSKLKHKYNRPYTIVDISNNSSYYLKDHFSHF